MGKAKGCRQEKTRKPKVVTARELQRRLAGGAKAALAFQVKHGIAPVVDLKPAWDEIHLVHERALKLLPAKYLGRNWVHALVDYAAALQADHDAQPLRLEDLQQIARAAAAHAQGEYVNMALCESVAEKLTPWMRELRGERCAVDDLDVSIVPRPTPEADDAMGVPKDWRRPMSRLTHADCSGMGCDKCDKGIVRA